VKFFTNHPPLIPGAFMPPDPPSPRSSNAGSGRGSASSDDYSSGLWKLAGIGMTMTSEVIGGALLGWGLDYLFKTSPVLLIIFTLLGLGVGMTGFIRSALGASGDAGRDARSLVAAGRAVALPPEDPEAVSEEAENGEDDPDDAESPTGHPRTPSSSDGAPDS